MIDWDVLAIGLLSFLLGLIGIVIKSRIKGYEKYSYTGVKFTWSVYILLGTGVVLIVWSII